MTTDEGDRHICDECLFCDQTHEETGERADLQAVLREYFSDQKVDYNGDSETEFSCDEDELSDHEDTDQSPSTFIRGYQSFDNHCSVLYKRIQDDPDYEIVSKFLERKCKSSCHQGPNQMPCCSRFTIAELMGLRRECRELDYNDNNHVNRLDMVIMAHLRALTSVNDETKRSKHSTQTERLRVRTRFMVQGWSVCENTFLFSFGISNMRYRKVKCIYLKEGMIEKPHGNCKRFVKKPLSFDYESTVVNFIRGYAEHHAIFLPAHGAAHWNMALKLLPASQTKYFIYKNVFAKTVEERGEVPVTGRTFYQLWKKCCPEIIVARPTLKLCQVCQKNFTNPSINTTQTEERMRSIIRLMSDFLADVDNERELHKSSIADTQQNGGMHLSFDVAQLVSIPHNRSQDGSLYFLCGFKIVIFSVMNKTVNCQHNFLIPESVSISNESSYIISILDYYLNEFARDVRDLLLHADSCSWLNKTNVVMLYLCYRIQSGLNDSIQLSFKSAGDTKFSSYWAFGLLKRKYLKSDVNTVQQVAQMIEQSTPESRINRSVPVSNEMGIILNVHFHRWQQYFDDMRWKRIPKLSRYAHFKFDKNHPTIVSCKKYLHQEGTLIELGKLRADVILEEELSSGLSAARQKYLYENVREFCAEEYRDILCPLPPDIYDDIEEKVTNTITEPIKKRSHVIETTTNNTECSVDVPEENQVSAVSEKRKKGQPENSESSTDSEILNAPMQQTWGGAKIECV